MRGIRRMDFRGLRVTHWEEARKEPKSSQLNYLASLTLSHCLGTLIIPVPLTVWRKL